MNHFCLQNPNFAKVKETAKEDSDDENEIAFAQHDLQLGRKRTQTEKLGHVKEFLDGLCIIVNVSILSFIIEDKTSKKSAFSQLMSRFTRFFSSHNFTTWASKHTLRQP